MGRCRICTTNDREALVEELAERMWESRRDHEHEKPWNETTSYWQEAFRQFAATSIKMLGDQ